MNGSRMPLLTPKELSKEFPEKILLLMTHSEELLDVGSKLKWLAQRCYPGTNTLFVLVETAWRENWKLFTQVAIRTMKMCQMIKSTCVIDIALTNLLFTVYLSFWPPLVILLGSYLNAAEVEMLGLHFKVLSINACLLFFSRETLTLPCKPKHMFAPTH